MANENNRLVTLVEGVIVNVGSEVTPGKAERVITELGREYDGLVSDGKHVCDASGMKIRRPEDYIRAVVGAAGTVHTFNEQSYVTAMKYSGGQAPEKLSCVEGSNSDAFWNNLD